jgi:translation initiation factor 5
MSEKVNIPRSVKDDFYRYQMPTMKTQVTGKHQGRETVILNLKDVAKALERDTLYIMKYFGIEFSSRFTCDDKGLVYQIHGNYEDEVLAEVLDDFIDSYVLCASQKCKLPETNLEIVGNKLKMTCRACGNSAIISQDHKLTNFILKNVKPGVIVKDIDDYDSQTNVIEEPFTWSVDTSDEAVEKRKQEALGEKPKGTGSSGENDVQKHLQELKEFVNNKPEITTFVSRVQRLQRQFGWSDHEVIQNLFMILFDNNIVYQINPLSEYIEPFVCDEKDQRLLLNCVEKLCHIDKSVIDNTPHILFGLYMNDIVEEETFYKWHKAMNKKLNIKISKQIRINAKKFIQWLQEAEVDDGVEEF